MGKSIQPRASSNEFGHANSQFGVAYHDRGQKPGVKDDLFFVRLRIGDDACASNFRTRPGRGGHGHNGGYGVGIGAGPPITDVFKIPERTGLPGQ